jgi:pimeloyl-ACP methyl ester carboxylesterase
MVWQRGIGHGRRMSGSEDRWLLLHGTPLTPAVWDGVTAYLAQSGTVSCPAITPPVGARDAQGALAARLAAGTARPAGRLHVVGHSFGGQVALDFTLLLPRRVATLTLLCSRDTPFPAFAAAAARLRSGDPIDAGAALSRWFTPTELDRDGPVIRYARRCLQQADRRSWADALDAIARYDRAGRTASIRTPTTLIAAGLDQVSTPAAMSALAGRLPRATLQILPGAAHMTPFTDPAALTRLLLRAAGRLSTALPHRLSRARPPRQCASLTPEASCARWCPGSTRARRASAAGGRAAGPRPLTNQPRPTVARARSLYRRGAPPCRSEAQGILASAPRWPLEPW